jgi:predicted transcriptional regulator
MEVPFTPDVQAKLDQMARDTGRRSDELVQDAVIGFFDELAFTRDLLERRYRDLESGHVQPIDGEEAYRRLMAKTEEHRRHSAKSQASRFTPKLTMTSTRFALTSPKTTPTPPTAWSMRYSTEFGS